MEEERMWQPSPTPEESYSDASGGNEVNEWPVHGVVGEELRLDGTSRYEVRWGDWHRKDGSNTTWHTEDNFERRDMINAWKKTQQRIRNSMAETSLDMEVPWPDDAVHKRLTYHRRQAYDEKLEKRRRNPISVETWDAEIEVEYGRLQEPERGGEANSKLRLRRGNVAAGSSAGVASRASRTSSPAIAASSRELSAPSSSTPKRGRGRPRIDSTPASASRSPATPSSLSHAGKPSRTPLSAGSSKDIEIIQAPLPSVIVQQPTLRGRLQSSWCKAAKDAMAAPVRISPDISDEDIPPNLKRFRYIERGYIYCDDPLQETFEVSQGVFTVCDCIICTDPSQCSCQASSELLDPDNNSKIFAYSKGLFTFNVPRGVEVIECNKYCTCDNECENRLAQRPRDIRVEIFDTKRCGWGVRALANIPRGKVLGTYTGMLVRREEVETLPQEHHGYLFDLDSTEVKGSENLGGRYTVDSYAHGNWTRFVNHSCSPNMEVYSVVYDTIPDVNMPYVAFVASMDIPAGTELTIDYHPHAEEDLPKKGKRAAKGGCLCESVDCRGWIKP